MVSIYGEINHLISWKTKQLIEMWKLIEIRKIRYWSEIDRMESIWNGITFRDQKSNRNLVNSSCTLCCRFWNVSLKTALNKFTELILILLIRSFATKIQTFQWVQPIVRIWESSPYFRKSIAKRKKLNDSNKWFLCSETLQSHSHSYNTPQHWNSCCAATRKKNSNEIAKRLNFKEEKYPQKNIDRIYLYTERNTYKTKGINREESKRIKNFFRWNGNNIYMLSKRESVEQGKQQQSHQTHQLKQRKLLQYEFSFHSFAIVFALLTLSVCLSVIFQCMLVLCVMHEIGELWIVVFVVVFG